MGLTFPRRDGPAELNYITLPISAAPLPDVSDVQASPASPPSRTTDGDRGSCCRLLGPCYPSREECKSMRWLRERGESGRHRRSLSPTTLLPALASCPFTL